MSVPISPGLYLDLKSSHSESIRGIQTMMCATTTTILTGFGLSSSEVGTPMSLPMDATGLGSLARGFDRQITSIVLPILFRALSPCCSQDLPPDDGDSGLETS